MMIYGVLLSVVPTDAGIARVFFGNFIGKNLIFIHCSLHLPVLVLESAGMSGKRLAYWASAPILGGIMGVVGYKLMAGRFFSYISPLASLSGFHC